MKNEKRKYELLSAYIDGELSYEEKTELERKIDSSLELKKKLEDLKNIKKLTSSAFSPLDESPYFETRLFASLASKKPWYHKIKKWSPVIGFAIITIAFLVVLKFNPGLFKNIIEEQKSNITGFYKENLQPLLFAADLNNDDIFNFAFYNQLPLDKNKNEYLLLGNDTSGRGYFEIKHIDNNAYKDNYRKFVTALDLNKEQRKLIDSVINEYADELKLQVLVNKQNTVAINENLWNYRKAIFADLMIIAEKTNKNKFNRLMPRNVSFANNPGFVNAANQLRMKKSKNYIILTPDSVFSENLEFNAVEFEKNLSELKKKLKDNKDSIKSFTVIINYDSTWKKIGDRVSWNSNFKITVDTNRCRVELFDFPSLSMHLPNMDSLSSMLDSMTKNFNHFEFFMPRIEHSGGVMKFHFDGDSAMSYEFKNFELNLDSLMDAQKLMIDSLKNRNWEKFYNFNDSLVWKNFKGFDDYFNSFGNGNELRKQMDELKEELRKFREEMKQWQLEMRKRGESEREKEVDLK